MSKSPVVTINTEAGPVRIERDQYNPDQHTLADKQDDDFEPFTTDAPAAPVAPPAPPAAPDAPSAPTTPPAPVTPPAPPAPPAPTAEAFVTKNGDKWALADADGKSVDGVEYDTKKAATDALEARNK